MAQILTTVQDLVNQVRSQLDETNRDTVSTEADILPSLNRGQDYAFDILARKYPEPLLTYRTLDLTSQAEYSLPEDIFEDRIEKIEISITPNSGAGQTQREVQRISFRDITNYESASNTSIPYYYCVIGNKIRFVPTPSGTYDARIWYLRSPEKLALPQGRITLVNTGSNYVLVDAPGPELATEADQLQAYVNVIDGQTGLIKATLQIQSINDNRITFRTTPSRSLVVNRIVSGSLLDMAIQPDDYLAPVIGTCVPYYGNPTTNFLIQFAVAEIVRKLGGESEKEAAMLEKFEKQVERTWVGREQTLRVNKRSNNWQLPFRRWYWR
jgi:hypothetical protein